MNNALRAILNNAIQSGVARGWVVQDCAITRQKEPNIMTSDKPDFTKIDFSKVDFGSLNESWRAELRQVGVLKLSTLINGAWRIVATRTNDEQWRMHFDVCVSAAKLCETVLASEIVDAFIASQPKKKWAVKTPYGYQWTTENCAAGRQRTTLIDTSTGKRDKTVEYRAKLAREMLEKYGSDLVDLSGNIVVTFGMQCEEV